MIRSQQLGIVSSEHTAQCAKLNIGHEALPGFYPLYRIFVDVKPDKLEQSASSRCEMCSSFLKAATFFPQILFLLSLVLLINIITKFCKHCGSTIAADAVICTSCGRQVEEIRQQQEQPQIVINNSNSNVNANTNKNTNTNAAVAGGKLCNKWVSFWLCLLLGVFGAHKFYEGKPLMGILYLCTMGLAFVGVVIDLIAILAKPNPYYA